MEKIKKLLADKIDEEQKEWESKPRSGLWNPSKFGRCYRMQYWSRLGEVETDLPSLDTLLLFRVGKMFHADIQALLPKESIEVEFTVEDIHGFADYVTEDMVTDFKTCGNWQWRKVNKKGYEIARENFEYVIQVIAYAMFLKKPKAKVIFIQKDTYAMKEFSFKVSDHVEALNYELDVLRGYWDNKKLPPAAPRCYGGKECQYCGFAYRCSEEENIDKTKCKDIEKEKTNGL